MEQRGNYFVANFRFLSHSLMFHFVYFEFVRILNIVTVENTAMLNVKVLLGCFRWIVENRSFVCRWHCLPDEV
jgi:hypothetical protein